mgnify:FL=1
MRLLNAPAAVTLSTDGTPKTISWPQPGPRTPQRPRHVTNVIDQWRYDGRWWEGRELNRDYYLLELDGGTQAELYHEDDDWHITRIAD